MWQNPHVSLFRAFSNHFGAWDLSLRADLVSNLPLRMHFLDAFASRYDDFRCFGQRSTALEPISGPCSIEIIDPREWRIAIPASLMRVEKRYLSRCAAKLLMLDRLRRQGGSARSRGDQEIGPMGVCMIWEGRASGQLMHPHQGCGYSDSPFAGNFSTLESPGDHAQNHGKPSTKSNKISILTQNY